MMMILKITHQWACFRCLFCRANNLWLLLLPWFSLKCWLNSIVISYAFLYIIQISGHPSLVNINVLMSPVSSFESSATSMFIYWRMTVNVNVSCWQCSVALETRLRSKMSPVHEHLRTSKWAVILFGALLWTAFLFWYTQLLLNFVLFYRCRKPWK